MISTYSHINRSIKINFENFSMTGMWSCRVDLLFNMKFTIARIICILQTKNISVYCDSWIHKNYTLEVSPCECIWIRCRSWAVIRPSIPFNEIEERKTLSISKFHKRLAHHDAGQLHLSQKPDYFSFVQVQRLWIHLWYYSM